MQYELYFLPKRVIDEYKLNIKNSETLTTPIIKRKVSAMIHTTKYRREQLNENEFRHIFNNVEIIVEEKNKAVNKINYYPEQTIGRGEGKFYKRLCKYYGLNDKCNNFSPVYISKGI